MTNNKIEEAISYLSKLMALHNENPFKVKAAASSAFQVDKLQIELQKIPLENLQTVANLSAGTIKKVTELLQTGKLQELQDLKNITPIGVQELLLIRGLGPKKCQTVWKEMGVNNPVELATACLENRLINYKGFSIATQESILQATNFYLQSLGKLLYADAQSIIENITHELISTFGKESVFITGEFARQEIIINQFEFVINAPLEFILDPLENENTFSDVECHADEIHFKFKNQHCIIYSCEADNVMEQLFFTIGPKMFTDNFIEKYSDIDFSITAQPNDSNVFEQAGITYIPPFLRHGNTNLEPNLDYNPIQLADIKGIIHNHSTYSDGAHTLEQMALACIHLKKEYLVISDHSAYASYAGGLDYEKILLQHAEIDALNKKLAPFKIFKSIECDILPNGDLDYTTAIRDTFDILIASVHSVLNMSETQAMERLEKAIANPHTSILGHPTGRLLLGRAGYPLDMHKIIELCAKHDVVIELNAHPRRLDIDWQYIAYAKTKNVLISINPDAHSTQGILDIQYGVLAAQKANVQAKQNLSSFSLAEMETFVSKQQLKRKSC